MIYRDYFLFPLKKFYFKFSYLTFFKYYFNIDLDLAGKEILAKKLEVLEKKSCILIDPLEIMKNLFPDSFNCCNLRCKSLQKNLEKLPEESALKFSTIIEESRMGSKELKNKIAKKTSKTLKKFFLKILINNFSLNSLG